MTQLSDIVEALKERRALQWLVAYLAAAWGLTEATGFAIDNYGVSRRLLDVLIFLLAVGLPTLLVLIWYHGAKGHQRVHRVEGFLLVALAAVAVTGGLAIGQRPVSDATFADSVESADLGQGSVAVLPFRNSVADATMSWLDRGIAELISTHLAQIEDLRVVGGQRLFDLLRQAGVEDSNRIPSGLEGEITRRAGARYMLTGAVFGRPDDMTITATLADSRTGEIAASTNARGSDIYALVDQVSTAMSSQIAGKAIERGELASVAQLTTASLEAYSEYRKGRDALLRWLSREAIEHLERAVELDSTFALAQFHLGTAHFQSGNFPEAFRNWGAAQEHLTAASERDRLFIEGVTTTPTDPEAGLSILRELIRKYPDEKDARLFVAGILDDLDPGSEEVRRLLEDVVRLDPFFAPAYNNLAYFEAEHGSIERADSFVSRYVALEPDEPNPLDSRGEILEVAGRYEEARDAYRAALAKRPDFIVSLLHLARSYLVQDRPEEAREELERFRGSPVEEVRVTSALLLGDTHVWEGRIERGIALYEEAEREAVTTDRSELRFQPLTEIAEANLDMDRYGAAYEAASRYREIQPLSSLWAFVMLDSLASIGDTEGIREIQSRVAEQFEEEQVPAAGALATAIETAVELSILSARGEHERVLALADEESLGGPDFGPGHLPGWPILQALLETGRAADALKAVQDRKAPAVFLSPSHQRFDPLLQRRLQYFEARAYEALRDTARAIQLYDELIRGFGDGVAKLTVTADAPQRLARLRGEAGQ